MSEYVDPWNHMTKQEALRRARFALRPGLRHMDEDVCQQVSIECHAWQSAEKPPMPKWQIAGRIKHRAWDINKREGERSKQIASIIPPVPLPPPSIFEDGFYVLDAVQDLDEVSRNVLIWHFWEDVPLREIANRLGHSHPQYGAIAVAKALERLRRLARRTLDLASTFRRLTSEEKQALATRYFGSVASTNAAHCPNCEKSAFFKLRSFFSNSQELRRTVDRLTPEERVAVCRAYLEPVQADSFERLAQRALRKMLNS